MASFVGQARISAVARLASLGARVARFRRTRHLDFTAVWVLAVLALIVAAFVGTFLGDRLVALSVVAAAVVAVVAYRYATGYEVVAVYEDGLIHAAGRQEPQVVWWEEIDRAAWSASELVIAYRGDREGPSRRLVIRARQGRTLVMQTQQNGKRVAVRRPATDGVRGLDRLTALVSARTELPAVDRARERLAAGEAAEFGPLSFTRDRVYVRKGEKTEQVPRTSLESWQRAGGILTLRTRQRDGQVIEWFRSAVANPVAASRMLDETASATPAADARALTERDLAAERDRLALVSDRRRRMAIANGAPLLAVIVAAAVLGWAPWLRGSFGYQDVCHGEAAPQAAAYNPSAPGPHPVDFEGDSGFDYNGLTIYDNKGILSSGEPASWIPASAADVQLVACVTTSDTTMSLSSCNYTDNGFVAIEDQKYTFTLYAARTGVVAVPATTIAGEEPTCPGFIDSHSPTAIYAYPTIDQINSIIGSAIGN